jgi:hypothetical protein
MPMSVIKPTTVEVETSLRLVAPDATAFPQRDVQANMLCSVDWGHGDDPPDDVGRAACAEGDDDGHRLGRIALREGRERQHDEHGCECSVFQSDLHRSSSLYLYSTFMPASRIAFAYFELSSRTKRANSSGLFPTRAIRSQVLSMRERGYIQIARRSGMGNMEIIGREMVPNLLPYLGASFVLAVITAILA